METTLIQTKLHPPYVSADLVERPLLLQKLNQLPEQPTAWLSLEEKDDDLAIFLTYFVAAI